MRDSGRDGREPLLVVNSVQQHHNERIEGSAINQGVSVENWHCKDGFFCSSPKATFIDSAALETDNANMNQCIGTTSSPNSKTGFTRFDLIYSYPDCPAPSITKQTANADQKHSCSSTNTGQFNPSSHSFERKTTHLQVPVTCEIGTLVPNIARRFRLISAVENRLRSSWLQYASD